MSNIYSVKYMTEAMSSLSSKVFKTPVNETYLFSTLNALSEMNTIINESTKKLYIQIAEAESKEDENKIFADYFYQFKNIFQNFRNKIEEMKSRMVISVENKIETWEELTKDDSYISHFDKQFSYSGWKFDHIDDSCYPRLNLYNVYQKEFDYIGQLMQDRSIETSPNAKLKIIASVSNNFSNYSNNKNWIKELIKDMIDIDDKEINSSYSECIYNSLRDKYEITVDKGMLYTCKESLCDYEDIINAATILCDNLLRDLDRVSENICSYLFRNEDKKLKIKTDTDGIIDRDYRLDTYSMNQLDLFLKNKINQIKKVLNIYAIAIGIKFDTANDYIDQNIDILKMAKTYDVNTVDTEDKSSEDDNMDDVSNNTDIPENEEEDNEDPEYADNNMSDDGDESIEEEPEEDDENYDIDFGESEKEEAPSENEEMEMVDKDTEEFEEAYLFESELFELQLMMETYEIHEYISEALLLEELTPAEKAKMRTQNAVDTDREAGTRKGASDGSGQKEESNNNDSDRKEESDNDNSKENLKKLANKRKENLWTKIMAKLAELWKKFKEAVFTRTKDKVEYLKKNAEYIKKDIKGRLSIKYTPDFEYIKGIKIPDFDYGSMKDVLNDETEFLKKYFNKPLDLENNKENLALTEYIKKRALGEEQPMHDYSTNGETVTKPKIEDAFRFCSEYPKNIAPLERQADILNRAQRAARNLENVEESNIDNDFSQYFIELKTEKDNSAKKEKRNNVDLYFKICSNVLSAQMSVYQKLFNEMYQYCKWYIAIAKSTGTSKPEEKSKDEPSGDNDGIQKL